MTLVSRTASIAPMDTIIWPKKSPHMAYSVSYSVFAHFFKTAILSNKVIRDAEIFLGHEKISGFSSLILRMVRALRVLKFTVPKFTSLVFS